MADETSGAPLFDAPPCDDGPLPSSPVASAAVPTRPSATSMDQTALVFLDDPIARRLAVAWVTCGGDEATWFETAGLAKSNLDAMRVSKSLKVNGVCRTGGVTDQLALEYIKALIAKPLGAARRKGDRT